MDTAKAVQMQLKGMSETINELPAGSAPIQLCTPCRSVHSFASRSRCVGVCKMVCCSHGSMLCRSLLDTIKQLEAEEAAVDDELKAALEGAEGALVRAAS